MPNGILRFKFHVKGETAFVNIDDRLALNGYEPYFTRVSKDGAFWMPLLEKAYAKLNQNYDRLNGGMPMEALRIMSGMPSVQVDPAKAGKAI